MTTNGLGWKYAALPLAELKRMADEEEAAAGVSAERLLAIKINMAIDKGRDTPIIRQYLAALDTIIAIQRSDAFWDIDRE